MRMAHEGDSISSLRVWVILKHGIFKPTRLKGQHGRASHEELMLHNATWLEARGHQSEVTAQIQQRPVCEELLRSSPEARWVLVAQVVHELGAVFAILVVFKLHASH